MPLKKCVWRLIRKKHVNTQSAKKKKKKFGSHLKYELIGLRKQYTVKLMKYLHTGKIRVWMSSADHVIVINNFQPISARAETQTGPFGPFER